MRPAPKSKITMPVRAWRPGSSLHLEAVFTTTVDCGVTERPVMPMPMSGAPDMGDRHGHPTLAPDCDCNRGLRSTPGGRSRPSSDRDCARPGHLAPVPAGGDAVAQPARPQGQGERLDPAPLVRVLGAYGRAGAGSCRARGHAAGPSRPDPG